MFKTFQNFHHQFELNIQESSPFSEKHYVFFQNLLPKKQTSKCYATLYLVIVRLKVGALGVTSMIAGPLRILASVTFPESSLVKKT